MLKHLLTLVAAIVPLLSQAQFPPGQFSTTTKAIGKNANGDSLYAQFVDMAIFDVVSYRYNAIAKQYYLSLRERGSTRYSGDYILCVDAANKRVLWKQHFKTPSAGNFVIGNVIARNEEDRCRFYSLAGKELAKNPADYDFYIAYADYEHKMFIARNGTAYDAVTLQPLWQAETDARFGWSDVYHAGKDTIIAVANGLRAIDLRTGEGWKHHMRTGHHKYGKMLAINTLAAIGGAFTGAYVNTGIGPDKVKGMCSEIVHTNSGYYFAGSEELIHFSAEGLLKWSATLPVKNAGHTRLWEKGKRLYLMNTGFAFMNGEMVTVADPFLACYNKSNGKLIYHTPLSDKGPVSSYYMAEEILYVQYEGILQSVNITTGQIIDAIEAKEELKGMYFVNNTANAHFWKTEHEMNNLSQRNMALLAGDGEGLYKIDSNLEVQSRFSPKDLYIADTLCGYDLYTPGENTILMKGNKELAQVMRAARPQQIYGRQAVAITKEGIFFYEIPE